MHARWGSFGLAGLLALAPALAGAQQDAATAVFASLEAAWARGDARGITAHVGSHKVSLAMPELAARSGLFSRSQTLLILAQHFESTETLSFRFLDMRSPEGGLPVAVGLAQRRLRPFGAGAVLQDRVLVTLVLEGDRWVLATVTVLR